MNFAEKYNPEEDDIDSLSLFADGDLEGSSKKSVSWKDAARKVNSRSKSLSSKVITIHKTVDRKSAIHKTDGRKLEKDDRKSEKRKHDSGTEKEKRYGEEAHDAPKRHSYRYGEDDALKRQYYSHYHPYRHGEDISYRHSRTYDQLRRDCESLNETLYMTIQSMNETLYRTMQCMNERIRFLERRMHSQF